MVYSFVFGVLRGTRMYIWKLKAVRIRSIVDQQLFKIKSWNGKRNSCMLEYCVRLEELFCENGTKFGDKDTQLLISRK